MALPEIFTEVGHFQKNKAGNTLCGDSFLSRKLKEEGRILCVLSDGLGSGVKAGVLSSMAATMAIRYTALNQSVVSTARSVIDTLPPDREKGISYATFCLLDIDCFGNVRAAEYDTPPFYLFRQGKPVEIPREKLPLRRDGLPESTLQISAFRLEKEDRLIFFTDGISQSGMGSERYPAGWESGIVPYLSDFLQRQPFASAEEIARRLVVQAEKNDGYRLLDDASCCVIYNRTPRNLLICTGPPYDPKNDGYLAGRFKEFRGKKVICGGTTARIISRELGIPVIAGDRTEGSSLPPVSRMDGAELVTEGILTLSRTERLLSAQEEAKESGAAGQLLRLIHNSDKIVFLVGTCINTAHQDPGLPVELEIRRNVVRKIKYLLETKFLKDVEISYL